MAADPDAAVENKNDSSEEARDNVLKEILKNDAMCEEWLRSARISCEFVVFGFSKKKTCIYLIIKPAH